MDVTAHETFTRLRYQRDVPTAIDGYEYLRGASVELLRFDESDEERALDLIRKYDDHSLSFHDALCAAMMLRVGIGRVFSFDNDFRILGFDVVPYV